MKGKRDARFGYANILYARPRISSAPFAHRIYAYLTHLYNLTKNESHKHTHIDPINQKKNEKKSSSVLRAKNSRFVM